MGPSLDRGHRGTTSRLPLPVSPSTILPIFSAKLSDFVTVFIGMLNGASHTSQKVIFDSDFTKKSVKQKFHYTNEHFEKFGVYKRVILSVREIERRGDSSEILSFLEI